jgi:uncharacterized membrane protein
MQGPPVPAPPSAGSDLNLSHAKRSRNLVVGLVLALIVLGLAWELWLAPTGAKSLALKVLPLACLVSGLARMRLSTYRALSLLVWVYALEGAMRGASDRGWSTSLGWIELALAFALFGACVRHIRQRVPARAKSAALN